MTAPGVRTLPLTAAEAMGLLAGVRMGRVAFSHRALPAIRLACHLVDGDRVVFRVHSAPAPPARVESGVVTYEADCLAPATGGGWTVCVTGAVHAVTDAEAERYRRALPAWGDADSARAVALDIRMITAYRLVPAPAG